MSLITKMRKQTAVYWAKTGTDGYGKPTYGTPVEITCRWEDVSQEFIDEKDNKQVSRSIVYVDRDMVTGDMLMLGNLDSGVDQDTPRNNDGAWEVRRFEKLPTLKATEFLRTAIL